MLRIFVLITVLAIMAMGFACAKEAVGTGGGATPTEAYKQLYAAVKSKDIEAIKRNLTKKTVEFGASAAARTGSTPEKMYENGFTESTFAVTLPTIRDERINGNMGAVEVWSAKKSTWEDLPFMLEDGVWKLAVGELFAGVFRSPGIGRNEREKEAANIMSPPTSSAVNANRMTPKLVEPPTAPAGKK
ncbi:MAG: hypothetical protein ABL999_08650 [Pyrinomonadaceae bacterium]